MPQKLPHITHEENLVSLVCPIYLHKIRGFMYTTNNLCMIIVFSNCLKNFKIRFNLRFCEKHIGCSFQMPNWFPQYAPRKQASISKRIGLID